ncbi:putative clathrin assembly protein, partial [Mucuna pruriens]
MVIIRGDDELQGLDAAIVKATNYEHVLPKEKHIRTIFHSLSPSKPRSEVVYCIHSLTRRLSQTNNWAVALKTLIVIHRSIRELDTSIWDEFVNYSRVKGYMIDISYFHDKSVPNDYSIWIRNYAIYLEERLQCFTVVNYDVATNSSKYSQKLDTQDLLEQLPALQNLLSRLLDCKPRGAVACNRLIQFALSVVAGESVKLYVAISVRVVELLDKFFEMHHNDARNALQIYQNSVSQAERLSEFYETCKCLDFGRGKKFINIKMPPASFMITMKEYIKEAPSSLMVEYNMEVNSERAIATGKVASVSDLLTVDNDIVNKPIYSSIESSMAIPPPQAAELMGLYDLLTGASEFDENSLKATIVPTGWEVSLFTEAESYNDNIVNEEESNEVDGMEVSNLDNQYDEVIVGTQQSVTNNVGQASHDRKFSKVMAPPTLQNALCALPNMSFPLPAQMVKISYQHFL